MAVLTDEQGPMPWDGIYALATPKRAFNMLFNIANVAHASPGHQRTGGSLMMYRSAHGAAPLLELPDDEVEREFLFDLYDVFPQARGHVRETQLLKLPRMLPYPAPGRAALQPALDRPLGRVHLAGDYLGGRLLGHGDRERTGGGARDQAQPGLISRRPRRSAAAAGWWCPGRER